MPILTSLLHWAETTPHGVAVCFDGVAVSFDQLRDRVHRRLAATEPAGGVTVIGQPNGIEFVLQFLAGINGEGRVAVLDPRWPPEQKAEVEARLRAVVLAVPAGPAPAGPPGAAACSGAAELADGEPDSTFLYGFTSGTTAVPKAFRRSRRSWRRSLERSPALLRLGPGVRTLAPGPLAASLNLYALAESVHAGGAFHSLSRFAVGPALACIERERISRIVAVPAVLRMLAEAGVSAGHVADGIDCIVSGGATLDRATAALLRRWAPNATVVAYYGAAELGFVAVSAVPPGAPSPSEAPAVGTAFPGVRIRVGGPGPLPSGAVGTIHVASDLVCDGYLWGDDGVSFRRDGQWCTVGDQGFLDDAGVLHHVGRRAEMIVTAGSNVYPQAVEATLQEVPGVQAVVVAGLVDVLRGRRLIAAVLATDEVDAARLRAASVGALAPPQRPTGYFRLSELPLTAAGKVSRALLELWIKDGDPRVVRLR